MLLAPQTAGTTLSAQALSVYIMHHPFGSLAGSTGPTAETVAISATDVMVIRDFMAATRTWRERVNEKENERGADGKDGGRRREESGDLIYLGVIRSSDKPLQSPIVWRTLLRSSETRSDNFPPQHLITDPTWGLKACVHVHRNFPCGMRHDGEKLGSHKNSENLPGNPRQKQQHLFCPNELLSVVAFDSRVTVQTEVIWIPPVLEGCLGKLVFVLNSSRAPSCTLDSDSKSYCQQCLWRQVWATNCPHLGTVQTLNGRSKCCSDV